MKERLIELKNNFDQTTFKRFFIVSILIVTLLLITSKAETTLSRYISNNKLNINPTVSFVLIDVINETKNIALEKIVPSNDPYLYSFQIANFDSDGKRAEVDLKYTIDIETTTNMPLRFRLYKDRISSQNEISVEEIVQDQNDVYYRHFITNTNETIALHTENKTEKYILSVEFPLEYKDYPDTYAGLIDLITVNVRAEQLIEEE